MFGAHTSDKNKHIYKEVIKPERLVLLHVTAPKFMMEANFMEQENKTIITIKSLFESEEQLKQVIKVFKADEGLKQNIDKLEEYLKTVGA